MSTRKLRPPSWQRWMAWSGTLGLFASGIALVLPGWMDPAGGAPLWEAVRLQGSRLHGALGMAFLIVLGSLAGHVMDGLRARRNTAWGLALLACLIVLVLSAWGLYYLPEDLKGPVAKAHFWCGIALPLLLFVHALKGRR